MSSAVRVAMFAAEKTEIEIETSDAVAWYELLTDANGALEKRHPARGPGKWKETLEAGIIYGLLTEGVRLREDLVTLVYADGKDPWPPPPPPPPPYRKMDIKEYEERFAKFALAAAESSTPREEPIIERGDRLVWIRPRSGTRKA